MKNILLYFIILFITIYTGCKTHLYMPTTPQTNLFSNSGELHASVYAGTHGVHGQAGLSITDRLFIAGTYMDYSYKYTSDDETIERKQRGWDASAGLYFVQSEDVRIELSGGTGMGTASRNTYDAEYTTRYGQVNVGATGRFADAGFALRYVWARYQGDYSDGTDLDKKGWFFEPYVFFRLGWKYIKVGIMAGFPRLYNREDELTTPPVYISFSTHLTFGRDYRD